jgi:outer membrane protein OmpA-like peptidoglycan-associated protein
MAQAEPPRESLPEEVPTAEEPPPAAKEVEEPARAVPPPPAAILEIVYSVFDRAEVEGAALQDVEKVAQTLLAYPEIDVVVEGHKDSKGAEEFNRKLSMRRAETVKRLLVEKGIAASRLSVRGKGFSKPAESNETEAGRAKNRRVIFIVGHPGKRAE